MMIKTESYKIFSEIYYGLNQLHWSYFLAMDTGVICFYCKANDEAHLGLIFFDAHVVQ